MKNIGRISLYILLGSFIIIQFFRVEKNLSDVVPDSDFLKQNPSMPEAMQNDFRNSCYNCHSINTDYPWYAHIAPFSWIINQHIRNGKHHMDLSEYGNFDAKKKIAILNDICEVISDSSMPPANYLMFHQEAVLDTNDITSICDWTDEAALMILRSR